MFIITSDNNQCTACHDPAIAQSMGATQFLNLTIQTLEKLLNFQRMEIYKEMEKVVANSSDVKLL